MSNQSKFLFKVVECECENNECKPGDTLVEVTPLGFDEELPPGTVRGFMPKSMKKDADGKYRAIMTAETNEKIMVDHWNSKLKAAEAENEALKAKNEALKSQKSTLESRQQKLLAQNINEEVVNMIHGVCYAVMLLAVEDKSEIYNRPSHITFDTLINDPTVDDAIKAKITGHSSYKQLREIVDSEDFKELERHVSQTNQMESYLDEWEAQDLESEESDP